MRSLRHLLDTNRPLTYGIVQAGENVPGGIPYIRPVDMTDSQGVVDFNGLLRTSDEIASAYKRSMVLSGDVVMSIGPSFGKVMIVPTELQGANLTQGTARLAVGPGLDARWLFWFLQSESARQFWESSIGGATFRALNLGPLGATPTPELELDEQRRIADFLDDQVGRIDQAIELRKEQRVALRSRIQIMIDTRFPSNFEGVQSDLVVAKHKMKVQPGYAFPADAYSIDESCPRLLRGINLSVGTTDWGDVVYWDPAHRLNVDAFLLCEGDLVIGMDRPWIGSGMRIAILTQEDLPAYLLQRVARIHPGPETRADFLQWAYRSSAFREAVEVELTGVSVPHLSAEQIESFRIPDLSLSEQDDVCHELGEVAGQDEALQAVWNRQISGLEERKRSLITAAVTGRLDVTVARPLTGPWVSSTLNTSIEHPAMATEVPL
jgi:type I restriction enzyme S subunit